MTQNLRYAAASRPTRWPAIVSAAVLGVIGGLGLSVVLDIDGQAARTSPQNADVVQTVNAQSFERRIERFKEEIQELNAENSTLRDRLERLEVDGAALRLAEKRVAELELELASYRQPERATPPPESSPSGVKQFEGGLVLVSGGGKPTERNDTWWRYSWQFTFANHSDRQIVFNIEVRFLDNQGFVVDSTTERGLSIPPRTNKSFRGETLITAGPARTVASVDPKVEIKG